MGLEFFRQEINEIDEKLTKLLGERLKVVEVVADYKKKYKLPIFQPEREREILKRYDEQPYVAKVYERILESSRQLQTKMLLDKNIVLIGMPGSGKTSAGRILAERLLLKFIDIDAKIAEREGRSVSEIFETDGEEAFRKIEAEVTLNLLEHVCDGDCDCKCGENCECKLGDDCGCGCGTPRVISTGGGIVLNDKVMEALCENGLVIFIDRPIDAIRLDLANDDERPLLKKFTLEELYESRKGKYAAWAHNVIEGNKDPLWIAKEIERMLQEHIG
ncbi:MAG: chorismate mutase [Clostridiales bacterium]|jgi:shikimate kinase|nr:chorismate mutase [Clostridiales bacterium]